MASTALNVNATSGATAASTPSHSFVSTSNPTSTQPDHQAFSDHSQKRVRLAQDHPTQPLTNGFVTASNDKSTMGWPFRPDIMQKFRCTFDDRFKGALKDTLSSYFARLKDTEEAVEVLKTECKELEGRINFIENTSKDLKTSLSERVVLPAPTTGVGQRRTLSSQAPRLPPVTPSTVATPTSIPDSVAQPTVAPPNKLAAPALPTSPAIRPSFHSMTCASLPITTVPPVVSKSSTKPMPPQSPLQTSLPPHPKPKTKSPLTVRPADMIDLTSEPSPSSSSAVDDGTPTPKNFHGALTHTGPNQRQQPQQPVSSPTVSRPAICTLQTASSATASTVNNQKIAWFTAHTVPVSSSRSTWIPVFQPKLLSYQELQRLPVAPLPPTPFQPSHHPPVQPMPQLTIAEAAEGVCLQWTVTFQSVTFEAATAYEIYSYASSELTSETINTCLPWKKVGEVAALPLPMACTLTHVQSNNMYYFIVRSFDRFRRYSTWSNVVNAYVG